MELCTLHVGGEKGRVGVSTSQKNLHSGESPAARGSTYERADDRNQSRVP